MESKFAALTICLQKAQVDVADAIQEKNEQAKLAAQYKTKADTLVAIINDSGGQNQRRIVELAGFAADLQDATHELMDLCHELEAANREWHVTSDRQNERNLQLTMENHRLQATAGRIQEQANTHLRLWVEEVRANAEVQRENFELKRSERRLKLQLARARKSRNKAQRRLYTLRAKVRKG